MVLSFLVFRFPFFCDYFNLFAEFLILDANGSIISDQLNMPDLESFLGNSWPKEMKKENYRDYVGETGEKSEICTIVDDLIQRYCTIKATKFKFCSNCQTDRKTNCRWSPPVCLRSVSASNCANELLQPMILGCFSLFIWYWLPEWQIRIGPELPVPNVQFRQPSAV